MLLCDGSTCGTKRSLNLVRTTSEVCLMACVEADITCQADVDIAVHIRASSADGRVRYDNRVGLDEGVSWLCRVAAGRCGTLDNAHARRALAAAEVAGN